MPSSQARVITTTPARYMTQLCKHFEHRRQVSYDATTGRIVFDAGSCDLRADDDALVMQCEAPDAEQLDRLQDVVARHLLRFAFREPPEITWASVG